MTNIIIKHKICYVSIFPQRQQNLGDTTFPLSNFDKINRFVKDMIHHLQNKNAQHHSHVVTRKRAYTIVVKFISRIKMRLIIKTNDALWRVFELTLSGT